MLEKINCLSAGKYTTQCAWKYAAGYIRLGNVSDQLFGETNEKVSCSRQVNPVWSTTFKIMILEPIWKLW